MGLIVLIVSVIAGAICSMIAEGKNRSQVGWFLIGFFFSLFGVILALVVGDSEGGHTSGREEKKCPHCAELVKLEAAVCKHCDREIS